MKQDFFYWHRRAQDSIAQGYLTNSKRPQSHVMGIYPTHVARGLGCHLWDHTGKRYVDYITGLGTNLLGYGNDRIAQAMEAELRQGYCHSFATHHEVECAEKVKEIFPFVDAVKFLKSGSEACSAALRIARTKTGRLRVLSDGYHGHHDHFVCLTPPALGTMSEGNLGIGPFKRLDQITENIAAVIVEPVITDCSESRRAYLQELRETCTKHGVVLIFDEVITGLRWPKFSVSSFWDITPDLIVLGKALGGGMPLAAVGGKYATMNCDEYFISSTYAGETLSLVAAKQAMTLLQTKYSLDHLWDRGQAFLDGFNKLWPEKITIEGYPSRGAFKGDAIVKALFFQECCDAGIIFGPSWFFNFPLIAETDSVLQVCRDVLTRIKNGAVELRGQMPKSPFAERVRAGNARA